MGGKNGLAPDETQPGAFKRLGKRQIRGAPEKRMTKFRRSEVHMLVTPRRREGSNRSTIDRCRSN